MNAKVPRRRTTAGITAGHPCVGTGRPFATGARSVQPGAARPLASPWISTLGRRGSRLIARVGLALVALQAATTAVLVVDGRRKRRRLPAHVPHGGSLPVALGDSTLTLYTHGVELYEAMLAAIERARDSIYRVARSVSSTRGADD